jgi:heme O synthase-like polyprenyltransferase
VHLAGHVYTRAILHSGPALSLRDVWRDRTAPGRGAARPTMRDGVAPTSHRTLAAVLAVAGVVIGVAVAVIANDVIIGVTAGAVFVAIATRISGPRSRHGGPPVSHH